MKRFALLLCVVFAMLFGINYTTPTAEAQLFRRWSTGGRYSHCGNPNCSMCNRNWGYLPGYGPRQTTTSSPSAPEIDSTPQQVVNAMLAVLDLKKTDTLYDLGCGDGRFLNSAVEQYGCKAVGFEIKENVFEYAKKQRIDKTRILIKHGDSLKYSWEKADSIVVYMTMEFLDRAKPQLSRTARVVSYCHPVPGMNNKRFTVDVDGEKHVFYLATPRIYDFTP